MKFVANHITKSSDSRFVFNDIAAGGWQVIATNKIDRKACQTVLKDKFTTRKQAIEALNQAL